MKKNILIGGAWPYGNYLLHIGHAAALLPADVIARYYRGCGDEVIYVSGTDAHGTPITERAKKEGKTPEEIASYYHEEDIKTFNLLNFSYDMYTTTDHPEHKKRVKEYFKKIYDNGYIYEKEVEEDYCEHCNEYLSDREVKGTCPHCGGECSLEQCDNCLTSLTPEEVLNKKCSTCDSKTITKNNKHLFFKLSAFQKELEDLIEKRQGYWRKQATGECKKFLNMGLIDRAATRQINWGIEVPIEGYEDKKIYVWIEAVLGYMTTGARVAEQRGINFDEFVSDKENVRTYFVHGKDNIPFHGIIYPALLKGINKDYQLPYYMISSGYVNMKDEKMSKSKGNLITANDIVNKFGSDTTRYYFLANGPEKKDSNFSYEDLINAHNSYLVNNLGNFVNRNLSFINKKFDGIISEGEINKSIKDLTINTYKTVGSLIEAGELKQALDQIFEYIQKGNKFYDENEPWLKVKENIDEFNNISYTCVYMIANIANFINPFMPEASNKIKNMLGLNDFKWEEEIINENIKINNLNHLFNRIEE